MIKFLPLLIVTSCAQRGLFNKDYITLSESPCVDGTILNIDQAGCESFYWGVKPNGIVLKVRCVYAPENSFWTETDFYAVPHGYDLVRPDWGIYCQDKYVHMYAIPRGERLEVINESR